MKYQCMQQSHAAIACSKRMQQIHAANACSKRLERMQSLPHNCKYMRACIHSSIELCFSCCGDSARELLQHLFLSLFAVAPYANAVMV